MTAERVKGFCVQHFWLLVSLYVMTLGIALCVRSHLGSSVISTLPYVWEQAGQAGVGMPAWTIGEYTIAINFLFVSIQIAILRHRFEYVQFFQLVIGVVFGWLLDVNMWLTSVCQCDHLWAQALCQWAGCTVLGTGIAFEVRCGSVTMPGEGMPIAISKVTGWEFSRMKIAVDITLVVLAVLCSYCFFGAWQWHIVGVGTLFAMVYVGMVVRWVGKRIGWFDLVLHDTAGMRQRVYGLARNLRYGEWRKRNKK